MSKYMILYQHQSIIPNLTFFMYRHNDDDDINAPPPQIQAALKNNDIGNLLDLDWDAPTETPVSPIMSEQQQQQGSFSDLLSQPQSNTANGNNIDDIMSLFGSSSSGAQPQTFSPQPQQQQQQQQFNNVLNDFTDDLFGSITTQSPVQQQKSSSSAPAAAKDPFADLF